MEPIPVRRTDLGIEHSSRVNAAPLLGYRARAENKGVTSPRSLQASLCFLVVLAAALFAGSIQAPAASAADRCGVQNGFGSFSGHNPPGACWRPYNDASPFNQPIPDGAPSLASSARYAHSLTSVLTDDPEVFGDDARDGGVAVYWSQPSDPIYELRCMKPWGRCVLEGLEIRVPAAAMPTGGRFALNGDMDAHMTIVDQTSGWEYDLWNVRRKDDSRRVIEFGWGGKTRIDGDGLGSDAIAARYGSLAGIIRPAELVSGTINHALLIGVPCTETYVYPATKTGLTCTEAGLDPSAYPPMGARMQLDLTPAEIERLRLPRWKKAIVTALARYGAFVSDTTGSADAWGFEYESGISYKSFGRPDPWVQWARALGVKPEDYNRNGEAEYWVDVYGDIPWHRMRFVSVCAAQGDCPPAAPGSSRTSRSSAIASTSAATIRRVRAVKQATKVRVRSFNRRIAQCRAQRNRLARLAQRAKGPRKLKLRRQAKRRTTHCMRLRVRKQHQLLLRNRKLEHLSSQI